MRTGRLTPVTGQPSAEYRRHHEVEAPQIDGSASRRSWWRVQTRLDALHADGLITRGQWQAAVEYRDAWGRVYAQGGGAEPGGGMRVSGRVSDGHQRMLDLLDTLAWLGTTEARLGDLATWLVRRCVVEDLSWREIGSRLHRDHKTAKTWTAEAVRLLAPAWVTRRRRRVDGLSGRPAAQRRVRAS